MKNSQKPVKTSKKDTFRQWIKNWDSHCLKYYYWCYYSKDCCCSAKHKQFITVANTNYYTKKQGRMSAATSVFCIIAKWAAETNSRVALRRDLQKKNSTDGNSKRSTVCFSPLFFLVFGAFRERVLYSRVLYSVLYDLCLCVFFYVFSFNSPSICLRIYTLSSSLPAITLVFEQTAYKRELYTLINGNENWRKKGGAGWIKKT